MNLISNILETYKNIDPRIKVFNSFKYKDNRGSLIKYIDSKKLSNVLLDFKIKEQYYSTSQKGVFRGFHYQNEPMQQTKFLTVMQGKILDFGICVNKESKYFGNIYSKLLDADMDDSILINGEYAHAIYAITDNVLINSSMNENHQPDLEIGYSYKTIKELIDRPDIIISDKDKKYQIFTLEK